jgi:hypothetical protein
MRSDAGVLLCAVLWCSRQRQHPVYAPGAAAVKKAAATSVLACVACVACMCTRCGGATGVRGC